jgi:hypothetical protein
VKASPRKVVGDDNVEGRFEIHGRGVALLMGPELEISQSRKILDLNAPKS